MFKKVMWATDGSEHANLALPHARQLAAEAEGELIAVHCVELTMPGKAAGVFPVYANEDEIKQSIENQVKAIAAEGTPARTVLTTASAGEVARAIAHAAREEGGDLLVVGTRGRGRFAGLLLGSVTQRLLHVAPCPVLVIPTRKLPSPAGASAMTQTVPSFTR